MTMPQPVDAGQGTLLYEWHLDQGANMAPFGGYLMPLWYPAGAKTEHLAVLTQAGIFDTSHMAVLTVEGRGSLDLLQLCFSADLSRSRNRNGKQLEMERCLYGVFLTAAGEVLDDAIVYRRAPERYMVVVNAGMGPLIAGHLKAHAGKGDVRVADLSGRVAKMDIQGPFSARILAEILHEPVTVLPDLPYFGFKGDFDSGAAAQQRVLTIDGIPMLLSRTGYTGEFGFEIFTRPESFVDLWRRIVDLGKPMGLIPCGLAARDSLRAGAVLPLSHQDIGAWRFLHNPWQFALPWTRSRDGFTKSFIGDTGLLTSGTRGYTYPFAGFDLRKVSGQGTARVFDGTGRAIGTVLTCVTDMGMARCGDRLVSVASRDKPADFKPRGICCGFVKVDRPLASGTTIRLKDHRRSLRAEVVDDIRPDRTARRPISDFYVRESVTPESVTPFQTGGAHERDQ